jgi:hypothetical protein
MKHNQELQELLDDARVTYEEARADFIKRLTTSSAKYTLTWKAQPLMRLEMYSELVSAVVGELLKRDSVEAQLEFLVNWREEMTRQYLEAMYVPTSSSWMDNLAKMVVYEVKAKFIAPSGGMQSLRCIEWIVERSAEKAKAATDAN